MGRLGAILLVAAVPLAALPLSGCGLLPVSKPPPPEVDPLQLLIDSPRAALRSPPTASPWGAATDKQLSPAPRQAAPAPSPPRTLAAVDRCLQARGIPAESLQPADPSNHDRRERLDAEGRSVLSTPLIIVLHETVASEETTLNLFRTPHPRAADQASYHMLIASDGRRVRIVADDQRAFGAGQSAFFNTTIRLQADAPGSINNIALHLSLVSPADGRGEGPSHSGYSPAQYRSSAAQVLLWQVRHGIPLQRLTTHKAIDLSQTRTDPRSFDWPAFLAAHRQLAANCGMLAYAASGG